MASPRLDELQPELLLEILRFTDLPSGARLARTSTLFCALFNDRMSWKTRFRDTFGPEATAHLSTESNWQAAYKKTMLAQLPTMLKEKNFSAVRGILAASTELGVTLSLDKETINAIFQDTFSTEEKVTAFKLLLNPSFNINLDLNYFDKTVSFFEKICALQDIELASNSLKKGASPDLVPLNVDPRLYTSFRETIEILSTSHSVLITDFHRKLAALFAEVPVNKVSPAVLRRQKEEGNVRRRFTAS